MEGGEGKEERMGEWAGWEKSDGEGEKKKKVVEKIRKICDEAEEKLEMMNLMRDQ